MPIKWNITGNAMKARSLMDQINTEYAGFIESGAEHLADIKALRTQVGEMQDDLMSAANIMGNSGNGSGSSGVTGKPPAETQAISETHIGKLAQAVTPGAPAPVQAAQGSLPEVGQQAAATFPPV